jgi:hypothetical protein
VALLHGYCCACNLTAWNFSQGLQGSLPEAAELKRRRRRQLLVKSEEVRYTQGTEFDMSLLQRKTDVVSSCTPSVLCDSQWKTVNDAILDIYAVNIQLGAMALCTGVNAATNILLHSMSTSFVEIVHGLKAVLL